MLRHLPRRLIQLFHDAMRVARALQLHIGFAGIFLKRIEQLLRIARRFRHERSLFVCQHAIFFRRL